MNEYLNHPHPKQVQSTHSRCVQSPHQPCRASVCTTGFLQRQYYAATFFLTEKIPFSQSEGLGYPRSQIPPSSFFLPLPGPGFEPGHPGKLGTSKLSRLCGWCLNHFAIVYLLYVGNCNLYELHFCSSSTRSSCSSFQLLLPLPLRL